METALARAEQISDSLKEPRTALASLLVRGAKQACIEGRMSLAEARALRAIEVAEADELKPWPTLARIKLALTLAFIGAGRHGA